MIDLNTLPGKQRSILKALPARLYGITFNDIIINDGGLAAQYLSLIHDGTIWQPGRPKVTGRGLWYYGDLDAAEAAFSAFATQMVLDGKIESLGMVKAQDYIDMRKPDGDSDMADSLRSKDLLFLMGVGLHHKTDFGNQTLGHLIQHRYDEALLTFVWSPLELGKVKTDLGLYGAPFFTGQIM